MLMDVSRKGRVMTSMIGTYGGNSAAEAKLRLSASIQRMLSSNRVVNTPADLRGFKVHVPKSQMRLKTSQRFGASPTPLLWPEVFQALESSVVEEQKNPMALTFKAGIFDMYRNFTQVKIERVVKEVLPFLAMGVGVLLLITFFPGLVLCLPKVMLN
jgi:TRAP-type C4-dicarboxylate transport system substrate-binding protein